MKLHFVHHEQANYLRPQVFNIFFLTIFSCLGMQEDTESIQKMRSSIAQKNASPIWKVGVDEHSREYSNHLTILKKCPIIVTQNGVYLLEYRGVRWSYYSPRK